MSVQDRLSFPAREVRRLDRDRFLTSLFAPSDRREALLALYAFNLELAQVREKVSQPLLGQIRLQWWRERLAAIFEGEEVGANQVAQALAEAVRRYGLSRSLLEDLIDARELDLREEPPATLDEMERYADGTGATVARLALEALGNRDEASMSAGRHIGIAWALIGLLRSLPFHAAAGRITLPGDILARHGVSPEEVLRGHPPQSLPAAVAEVAELAAGHLRSARSRQREVPRAAIPALLLAPLADRYLAVLRRHRFDTFRPEVSTARATPLRLVAAALSGRY